MNNVILSLLSILYFKAKSLIYITKKWFYFFVELFAGNMAN